MKKYIIIPDVNCDLSPELREKFGVRDYIHSYVHFSNGLDFQTHLDWDTMSREEFYKLLSSKQIQASTSPASPEECYNIFKSYAEQGYDILSISLSTKISSTHASAQTAAKRVQEEYPDCNIYCVDSMRMSGAIGLLTIHACEMQAAGKSMQEVVDWLEENKYKVHQMGPIDDLMFVARRGRISTGKAIFGSFAGVKPMGDCNAEGYVTVITKAKGIKKALKLTVAYIKEAATDIENQYVVISHTNREEYAMQLKEQIEAELHPKAVFVSDVFTSCGTNIGPGMIGAYFLGDPVSQDGEAEKAMMNRAIESCS